LGRDFPDKITDFAEARNSFLENNDWVLFLDSDEEVTPSFKSFLDQLEPSQPYYWVRRVNLYNGHYRPSWNPDFKPALVSSKIRFVGSPHERVTPKNPHGLIDIPIIHNHTGSDSYKNSWPKDTRPWQLWLGMKKAVEVARGR
jgi:hypothetical protein